MTCGVMQVQLVAVYADTYTLESTMSIPFSVPIYGASLAGS